MFLRKAKRREPVPITMTGVRMGERVLQVGVDDAAVAGAIAAKAGLSGNAAALVTDAEGDARLRAAATEAGVLMDIQSAPLDRMPFPDAGFDVIVVHGVNGRLAELDATLRDAALRECRRVLRQGGRIVTIEAGTRRGMAALFLGRAAEAVEPLKAAIAGLPETSAWHHLGCLYLALAQAR